jgi:hypothetical protein
MKRTEFKRKLPAHITPERKTTVHTKLMGVVRYPIFTDLVTSIPKENVVRSEAYRRLVAAMPCIHCGLDGSSQAAHGDEGKGAHIKSSDLTCYPACTDGPGRVGCHSLIGTLRIYTAEVRRPMEEDFARRTRAASVASGKCPADLLPMIENYSTN